MTVIIHTPTRLQYRNHGDISVAPRGLGIAKLPGMPLMQPLARHQDENSEQDTAQCKRGSIDLFPSRRYGILNCPKAPGLQPQTPTFEFSLLWYCVDVISNLPEADCRSETSRRKTFRLFDNRHEVRISTFDAGARYDTRPIAVWLVVICNESELPKSLPVVVFLHGDHTGQPHGELNGVQKYRHLCVSMPFRVRSGTGSDLVAITLSLRNLSVHSSRDRWQTP